MRAVTHEVRLDGHTGIWVLAEHDGREAAMATVEVLGEARRLADQSGDEVVALLVGSHVYDLAESFAQYGADKVLVLEHEILSHYTTDGYVSAVADLVREKAPGLLLVAWTPLGRDFAPRLSTRLNTALVTDCTGVSLDDRGAILATRPTYGDRVYATIRSSSNKPLIAGVRPGILGFGRPQKHRVVEVKRVNVALRPQEVRTRVLGSAQADRETVDISEADTIVAFGRGLGDKNALAGIEALAELLNAPIAGSRVAVDAGWIPFERQIGQTGKAVAPKLIICAGISGASQFLMGIQDSKLIVAINTDQNAPIFAIADIPIVGDLRAVVPAIVRELRQNAKQEASA